MIRSTTFLIGFLLIAVASPGIAETAKSDQAFDSMAQPVEPTEVCVAPRPPRELHSFAYVRNGYREILRILAAEMALDAKDCGCRFGAVGWEDAVAALDRFKTSDNPKLPFDVIDLRKVAVALEADLETLCSN